MVPVANLDMGFTLFSVLRVRNSCLQRAKSCVWILFSCCNHVDEYEDFFVCVWEGDEVAHIFITDSAVRILNDCTVYAVTLNHVPFYIFP